MKVTLVTASKREYIIEIKVSDQIITLKEKAALTSEFCLDNVRVIYNGRLLDDSKTVADYRIAEESRIHILLAFIS